jgi:hypothetical protein
MLLLGYMLGPGSPDGFEGRSDRRAVEIRRPIHVAVELMPSAQNLQEYFLVDILCVLAVAHNPNGGIHYRLAVLFN